MRKPENEKTRKPKRKHFLPFSCFRVSRCSHLRASSIASLIDCSVSLLAANMAFLLSPFSGLRVFAVFAVFAFSPFSGFRRFRVFAVFAVVAVFAVFTFSPFSGFCVFAFSCSQVDSSRFRVFALSHVQSWRFRATEWTASVHTLHMPKALRTFIVLRNGLLRNILYTLHDLRDQSATESSASVHDLQMPKAVITCSKCYGMVCFGTYELGCLI